MDVSDILKQQQAMLDTLQKQLAKPNEAGLVALLGNRDQQAAAIKARIDELVRQKAASMQRFDTAIEEQKKALAALQGATAATGQVLQGLPPPAGPKTG